MSFKSRWRAPVTLTPAQKAKLDEDTDREAFGSTSQNEVRHDSGASRATRASQASISDRLALINYQPRTFDIREAARYEASLKAGQQRADDRQILDRVRPGRDQRAGHGDLGLGGSVTRFLKPRDKEPDRERLLEVATNAFPPRMELPVMICDIFEDTAHVRWTKLGDIEGYWKDKPDEVVVRWIHAPLGTGTIHSTIEDMFRHDQNPGRAFWKAGIPGFPFLELDSLQFRQTDELQHLRDVYTLLKERQDLTDTLNKLCLTGDNNETFEGDIAWRLKQLGKRLNWWDLAVADIPFELSERLGFGDDGPLRHPSFGTTSVDLSVLGSKCDQFEHAQLVLAPFRCWHRNDGTFPSLANLSAYN